MAQRPNAFASCEPKLSDQIVKNLESLKFTQMTPVQAATIPLFLSHKDVAVEACTGSGKTLAFLIPTIEMLLRKGQSIGAYELGGIVVSPTRELATQIFAVLKMISVDVPIRGALTIGGRNIGQDMETLRNERPDILISTPGRLLDLLQRKECPVGVRELEVLVLDEADVLLDLGFEDTLNKIFVKLPKQRRTGLFSATQTKAVRALARAGMRNPVKVCVKVRATDEDGGMSRRTPSQLESFYRTCKIEDKLAYLVEFLRHHATGKSSKAIVFVATCACVDYLSVALPLLSACRNLDVLGLHGKMVQKRRELTFERFSRAESDAGAKSQVLICTDVAARGLDVPDVKWIVQYDPPKESDFFVHRVGRTARAGRSGRALVLLLESEIEYVDHLRMLGIPMKLFNSSSSNSSSSSSSSFTNTITSAAISAELRALATNDRNIMEKGLRAFVSFVRAYKAHILRDVFPFKPLKLGAYAQALGLLKLPKMPEFRSKKATAGFDAVNIDIGKIKYKNSQREKQRLQKLAQEKQRKKQTSSSCGENRTREKKQPFDKKRPEKKRKRKGKHKRIVAEWEQLQLEERLYKRLKKGKISKDEYELKIRGLDKKAEEDELRDDEESDLGGKARARKRGRKKKKGRWVNR